MNTQPKSKPKMVRIGDIIHNPGGSIHDYVVTKRDISGYTMTQLTRFRLTTS